MRKRKLYVEHMHMVMLNGVEWVLKSLKVNILGKGRIYIRYNYKRHVHPIFRKANSCTRLRDGVE
jgi:hypothetical protein